MAKDTKSKNNNDFRSSLAEQIYRRITDKFTETNKSDDAFVVSLYGEWGVGKTKCLKSIENFFQNDLNEFCTNEVSPTKENQKSPTEVNTEAIQTAPTEANVIIPIFFNAWMYEKEEHLIVPLLKTIEQKLYDFTETENKQESKKTDIAIKSLVKKSETSIFAKAKNCAKWLGKAGNLIAAQRKGELKFELFKTFLYFAGKFALKSFVPENMQNAVTEFLEDMKGLIDEADLGLEVTLGTDSNEKDQTLDATSGNKKAATNSAKENKDKVNELEQLQKSFDSLYYNFHAVLKSLLQKDDKSSQLNLVVLVDDLDRCLPDKAIDMLESIKLFLNVPGFAFVLAVDDDVVERGIRHRYQQYEIKSEDQENGGEERLPPITGHEYLEKIVNLPCHLNRWEKDEIDQIYENYANIKKLAKFSELENLIENVVPPVPRKIVRLLEALDFQYQNLIEQLDKNSSFFKENNAQNKEKITNKLIEHWNLLSAARTTIVAQLYPELYREMRQGRSSAFWQMLYSLVALPSGEIGFDNSLYIALQRAKEILKLNTTTNPTSPPAQGINNPSSQEPQKFNYFQWSKKDLINFLKNEQVTNQTTAKNTALKALLSIGENQHFKLNFTAIQLKKFLSIAERLCNSRNGLGLLDLWQKEKNTSTEKMNSLNYIPKFIYEQLKEMKLDDGEIISARHLNSVLMGGSRERIYNDFHLHGKINLAVFKQIAEDLTKEKEISTSSEIAETAERTEEIQSNNIVERTKETITTSEIAEKAEENTSLYLNEKEYPTNIEQITSSSVENDTAWIAAILSNDINAIKEYQDQYSRSYQNADESAYSKLIGEFYQWIYLQEHGKKQAIIYDLSWQKKVKELLGKDQLSYLVYLQQQYHQSYQNSPLHKDDRFSEVRLDSNQQEVANDDAVEAIKDNYLGIYWQKNDSQNNVKKKEIKEDNGYRLPWRSELTSLLDYRTRDPATSAEVKRLLNFNTSNWYWSKTPYDKDRSWVVYFNLGGVYSNGHDYPYLVRLVRSF